MKYSNIYDLFFLYFWFYCVIMNLYIKNKLHFVAYNSTNGNEIWAYDGVNPPTMVADIYPGTGASNPISFTIFNNKLYLYK